MNWLTNFVRPKIQKLVRPKEVPDNLWTQCPKCSEMIFHRELEKNLRVCTHCGHHMRMPVRDRLRMLFDNGQWTEIEIRAVAVDPLRFKDRKRYADRYKEAQTKTGLKDAVIVAHGTMGGIGVVISAFEFDFMGGSMGAAVGEALIAAAELAVLQEAPLIVLPSSGGARMQEGILSLMQMARTTVAVDKVREKGLPYIVVLTDPTTGGVTASFAMLGDVALAEPGAIIGFAGSRVIEQTIREKLPEGFQRSEYLMEHGMVDMVVNRHELRAKLVQLLGLLLHTNPAAPVVDMPAAARRRKAVERTGATAPPDPSSRTTTKRSLPALGAPMTAQAPVDIVLERMTKLHPKLIDMSLDRVYRLLDDLGNPQDKLPPVIHVAGTNGKGSTIATMRAVLEAAGYKVHVYTSPHLVSFVERIRLVGSLIDEDLLIQLLEHIEQVNAGKPITFFEVTTIAAFLAFARIPADVTLLETGMGGRLDATNVVKKPLATVITSISKDHTQFLGDTIALIAGEKAAIMKPGVPSISVAQHPDAAAVIAAAAGRIGASLKLQDRDWRVELSPGGGFTFTGEHNTWSLPQPSLPGAHQYDNAGAALAALDQARLPIPPFALKSGLRNISWPARAQVLTKGPLRAALPNAWELWLDGGHNAGGGQVLAKLAADRFADAPLHLVVGMLSTKAADDFLRPLIPHAASVTMIPIPNSPIAFSPADLNAAAQRVGYTAAVEAESAQQALARILTDFPATRARVLICGALYLAGEVLKENG